MPELPEVETVCRGLVPVLERNSIERVDVNREGLRWPFPADLANRLKGVRIKTVRRRSKYILLDISSGYVLLIHLGMSGRIVIEGYKGDHSSQNETANFVHKLDRLPQHDHLIFHLHDKTRVILNDPRRFGVVDLFKQSHESGHKLIKSLGPEPLGNQFDHVYLEKALKRRKAPIKSVLLDQSTIAGLGNIYVCEALWRAKISPLKRSCDIKAAKLPELFCAIQDVLRDAIDAGGSTLNDYRRADGELGYFQHQFAVYGRENERCERETCTGEITRITQSGRSSFFCSTCQVN